MKKTDNERLTGIAHTILDEHSSDTRLIAALNQFASLCSANSNVSPSLSYDAHAGDTELKQGVAINPEAAAQCVLDYRRSVAFIRGLYAAITDRLCDRPEQRINILYAGCGPYATILLPLLSVIETQQLNICLIDIHEESLSNVQQLVDRFNFNNVLMSYWCENACEFTSEERFDIVLAETMQKALEQEPQFLVTQQLCQFLKPNGIFLPQQINVDLCIKNKTTKAIDNRLMNIFQLTSDTAQGYNRRIIDADNVEKIELNSVVIPNGFNWRIEEFVFSTQIIIYQTISLSDNEAQITLLSTALDLNDASENERWRAVYQLGPYPMFRFILEP